MSQFSLVLPFGLPPAELAPDLVRALEAPSLSKLLSRQRSRRRDSFAPGTRTLPHESWLQNRLGSAFAPLSMRGFGLDPGDGYWFIVNPVHIQVARNHLLLTDQRKLKLADAQSRALFEAAKPYFDETGNALVYGDANTWFMRGDTWQDLSTASPDAATSQNLSDWMPLGDTARACRKLQNEVQMLWYSHPVNEQREAEGLTPINGFWPWAPGLATPSDKCIQVSHSEPWLGAIENALSANGQDNADNAKRIAVDGRLASAAIAGDWAVWLQHMQQLEREYFAPLLQRLREGGLKDLTLVLSHGTALLETTNTKAAQYQIWRRPTLNALLP